MSGQQDTNTGSNKRPVVLLLLLTAVSAALLAAFYQLSFMTTDTAQYISVARNLLAGQGLTSSLIYFDIHFQIGGVPVPQTVWPPGFPLLIALFAAAGINVMVAPFVVSLLSFLTIPYLLHLLVRRSGGKRWVAFSAGCIWLFMALAWSLTLAGTTEMVFTCCVLLSMLSMANSVAPGRSRYGWLAAAGVLAAGSVAVRYPGIFFVSGIGLYFLVRCLQLRNRQSLLELLAFSAPAVALTGAIFLRNYLVAQTMLGSGLAVGAPSLQESVSALLDAIFKLLGIGGMLLSVALLILLAGVFAMALFPLTRPRVLVQRAFAEDSVAARVAMSSLCFLVVTVGSLAWLSLTQTAGYLNERYLLPLLPFLLIWLNYGLAAIRRSSPGLLAGRRAQVATVLAASVFVVGQMTVFAHEYRWYATDNRYQAIEAALESDAGGMPVRDHLQAVADSSRPLLAPNGQLLGAILDRPVVGLPAPLYTDKIWTSDTVRELARRYNISRVVLIRGAISQFADWSENQAFFRQLARGDSVAWLEPEIANEHVLILKLRPAS